MKNFMIAAMAVVALILAFLDVTGCKKNPPEEKVKREEKVKPPRPVGLGMDEKWITIDEPSPQIVMSHTSPFSGYYIVLEGESPVTVRIYIRKSLPPDNKYWLNDNQVFAVLSEEAWPLTEGGTFRQWSLQKGVYLGEPNEPSLPIKFTVYAVLVEEDKAWEMPGVKEPYYLVASSEREFIEKILPYVYKADRRAISDGYTVTRKEGN